jgi:hypothetical protein
MAAAQDPALSTSTHSELDIQTASTRHTPVVDPLSLRERILLVYPACWPFFWFSDSVGGWGSFCGYSPTISTHTRRTSSKQAHIRGYTTKYHPFRARHTCTAPFYVCSRQPECIDPCSRPAKTQRPHCSTHYKFEIQTASTRDTLVVDPLSLRERILLVYPACWPFFLVLRLSGW